MGSVRVTLVYDDGTTEQKDYTLPANARLDDSHWRVDFLPASGQTVQRSRREPDTWRADHRGVRAISVAHLVRRRWRRRPGDQDPVGEGAPAKRLPLMQSDSRKRKNDERGKRTKAGAAAVLADRQKASQFRRWPGK